MRGNDNRVSVVRGEWSGFQEGVEAFAGYDEILSFFLKRKVRFHSGSPFQREHSGHGFEGS